MPRKTDTEDIVIRDFGGGWNVADDEKSLDSRFQVISDNIVVGIDSSLSVRYGYKLDYDFKQGVETEYDADSATFTTNVTPGTETLIVVVRALHTFASGDHVTFSGLAAINGIPAEDLNTTHGIVVIDANTYHFHTRSPATSASGPTVTPDVLHDTHILQGDTLNGFYFKDILYVFSANGEVAKVTAAGVISIEWNFDICNGLNPGVAPWRKCSVISADIFQQRLLAVNGLLNDKPLEISPVATNEIDFLVDPAVSTNTKIPKADFIITMAGYSILASTDRLLAAITVGEYYVEFSALNARGVYDGAATPVDAVSVDLSNLSASFDPRITGMSKIRNNLFVSFYDQAMLGTIGNYDTGTPANHIPDFTDTIPEHGALSQRCIVSLGNSLLMCDYAGVPFISVSSLSGSIVPERASQSIDPSLQKNIARLDNDTKRTKVFAVYSIHDRQYMLFMPKYKESDTRSTVTDPITLTSTLGPVSRVLIVLEDHGFEAGDVLTIANAATIGDLDAGDINGAREIIAVVDRDTIAVAVGATYASLTTGGGATVTLTPVTGETVVYVYTLNERARIRRWTRFRGWNFAWAARTPQGRVLVGKGGKVYTLGTIQQPIYSDQQNDYDFRVWAVSTVYAVDDRVLDTDGIVYICLVGHTSDGSGSFTDHRNAHDTHWKVYVGESINFVAELPWADMGARTKLKQLRTIGFDTSGRGRFTFSIFVDNIYRDQTTYTLSPARSMDFVGSNVQGYGLGQQPFGGGRSTRDELLYAMPVRGRIFKLRFEGATTEPLQITAIRLPYLLGDIRR